MKTRIFITFLLLTALGFFSSCEKKEDNPDNGNTDSTGGFNAVLFPGNGWKSIARIHAKNTAATGYQWYDVTACGLSIDYSDVLHFILVDAKQSQQDVWNTWYEGTVNLSSGDDFSMSSNGMPARAAIPKPSPVFIKALVEEA